LELEDAALKKDESRGRFLKSSVGGSYGGRNSGRFLSSEMSSINLP
jgi:hypothetical protein